LYVQVIFYHNYDDLHLFRAEPHMTWVALCEMSSPPRAHTGSLDIRGGGR